MTSITHLVEREAQAEQARGKADAKWRAAWWDTTTALGTITDRTALRNAVDIASVVLNLSRGYVQKRVKTGRVFRNWDLRDLPPRMAMEAAANQGSRDVGSLVASIKQAETDGISLREFRERLTGKAWADTPAGASKETIEQIVRANPAVAAQAVLGNSTAERAFHDAHHERLREQHPNILGPSPETAEGKGIRAGLADRNAAEEAISQPIYRAAVALQTVQSEWDLYAPGLSAGERAQVARTLRDIVVAAEALSLNLGLEEVSR